MFETHIVLGNNRMSLQGFSVFCLSMLVPGVQERNNLYLREPLPLFLVVIRWQLSGISRYLLYHLWKWRLSFQSPSCAPLHQMLSSRYWAGAGAHILDHWLSWPRALAVVTRAHGARQERGHQYSCCPVSPVATDAQPCGVGTRWEEAQGVDHQALFSKRGRKFPVPGGGPQSHPAPRASVPVGKMDPRVN